MDPVRMGRPSDLFKPSDLIAADTKYPARLQSHGHRPWREAVSHDVLFAAGIAAVQDVITAPTSNPILAALTRHHITSRSAAEPVFTTARLDRVITTQSHDDVVPICANQLIITGGTDNRWLPTATRQRTPGLSSGRYRRGTDEQPRSSRRQYHGPQTTHDLTTTAHWSLLACRAMRGALV